MRVERDHVVHGLVGARHELLDAARSLADAVLVFDQCETNIVVALLTETDTGSHGHVCLLDQKLGEFKRTEMAEFFRDMLKEWITLLL